MARILLVDDDVAEISAVKRVLARGGHQPVLATNAADALASVARSRPDLLVVAAACEDGEALRRCSGAERAQGVPLLVLGITSAAPSGAAQVARPVDPAQLADEIAAALAAAARAAPPPEAGLEPELEGAPPGPGLHAIAAAGPRAAPRAATPEGGLRAPAPADAAARSRRAAAEALRARAEELRRASAAPAPQLEDEDPGLEAILRRAEEAERAHAAERSLRAQETERARLEAEQRERAAAAAEARRAEAEAQRRASAERLREESARRGAEEARARDEEARREAERARAVADARARAEAEEAERARAEAERRDARRLEAGVQREALEEDRRRLETELAELHAEVEAERRPTRALRAAAPAVPGDGRRSREDARARDEEETLRAAIASARAEMETLRRRGEEEARRRAEAEAEVARLAQAAARRDEADRRVREAEALPSPLAVPVYRPPAEEPRPDPAEEAARRRVAAARERERSGERRREAPPEGDGRRPAPPPQELRAGTLSELPAPRLLALAARATVTGRLDLEGATARSLWLEQGRVVGATSADPGERVEELALRLGLVTRDQHRQVATAAVALSSRRCALLLVEQGFVKPGELTALVRRRTEEVVFGAFADEAATFRLEPAGVPAEERIQLDRSTLALAVEGVRRRWLAPRVDAVLGGAGTLLAPVPGGPAPDDLGLSVDERRALALADGLRTVDEVVAASPLDDLSTRQVLAALVLVGALAVRVFQGGRPAAVATAAIDLARVWDKLEQARRADYFTILGVSRRCTPHEVREAAERLSAELEPSRFAGVHEEGLEARLEEILGVVADAREILVDDRLRTEYLRGLGE